MGVIDVLSIGLTTDHALLSPDGQEVWFTSNAEHNIYVLNVATHEITTITDPADGDIHGGVWVQYKDDGHGGVIGEVVADYGGLHGSALQAQRQYVSEPALTIALNRSGFLQKSLTVPAGQALRLVIKNVAGTSAGLITFQSDELGIQPVSLKAGESYEARWTAPAQPGALTAKVNKTPNDTLTITVTQPAAQPTAVPSTGTGGPQVVEVRAHTFAFDVTEVTVQAGQPVRFVFSNADDEKHNLVGVGEGLNLISPDAGAGQSVTYDWTAPATPGTYKVVCAYHSQMSFTLIVK
jgi:plastocyanin